MLKNFINQCSRHLNEVFKKSFPDYFDVKKCLTSFTYKYCLQLCKHLFLALEYMLLWPILYYIILYYIITLLCI